MENNNLENNNEEMSVQMCNPETIPCKDCFWGKLGGILKNSCAEFKQKPYDVYFESQPCPKFRKDN